MKWLPMETAPKDGTCILAWDGRDMAVVYWHEGLASWELRVFGTYADDANFDDAKCWATLPKPPTE